MNLKNAYWYFTGELGDNFCDEVIKLGNSKQEKIGVTGGASDKVKKRKPGVNPNSVESLLNKKDLKSLKKQRDSNVVWLNDQWIYNELCPLIEIANKNSGWNFQYDYFESIQFTKYKLNQFYDWHCDPFPDPYVSHNDPNFHGKTRKISAVLQLSDPKDYRGGELEIQPRTHNDPSHVMQTKKHFKPRGSFIVFPSHLWHRVKPVTKGTRYSLVLWGLGYPFR